MKLRAVILLVLACCAAAAGCGGNGDGESSPKTGAGSGATGPKLHVASPQEYVRATRAIAAAVARAEARGPQARARLAAADTAQRQSERLNRLTPPQQVLSEHQFLTDALATLELDLRQTFSGGESRANRAEVRGIAGDFRQVRVIQKQIEQTLGRQ